MNVVLLEEIAARETVLLSGNRKRKNADNSCCDDVKGELTAINRRSGRRRVKSARGLMLVYSCCHICCTVNKFFN